MRRPLFKQIIIVGMVLSIIAGAASAQTKKPAVRTVTIPISIFTKQELKDRETAEFVQADRLMVIEDKDEQQILSIRSVTGSPLAIAILIQDDLAGNFNLQIDDIKQFIRGLPRETRVMVAYLRGGTMQVRQKFTEDLDKAANSLRIVVGSAAVAPRSPYDGVSEALSRFDAVPAGRRAVLLFSDGLDTSEGLNASALTRTFDLDRAILKAQRKSVAVYSFYAPTTITDNGNSALILASQGALQRMSDETGGRSFFQGSIAPISYTPFFTDLVLALSRQFALTYLSTHMNKGYHKVEVESTNPEVKIDHPKGYYYR